MHPTLEQTQKLVRISFEGQTDKGGDPLFNHIARVVSYLTVTDEMHQHTAWLHDLVEDTPITIEDLQDMGYHTRIITAVRLLTHDKKEMKYPEYIDRICQSGNTMAIRVKLADQRDNLDPKRWLYLETYMANALRKRYAGVLEKLEAALGTA